MPGPTEQGYGVVSATAWDGAAAKITQLGYYALVIPTDIWQYTVIDDNPPNGEVVSPNVPPKFYISSAALGLG